MAETKRPGVMGAGEEETFVRKLQYSLLFVEDEFENQYLLRIKHS